MVLFVRSGAVCLLIAVPIACGGSPTRFEPVDAVDAATTSQDSNEPSSPHGETDSTPAPRFEPDVDFIVPPDGGSLYRECDPWAQDCGPGEKCAHYSSSGGGGWDATTCVPVAVDPDQRGDPCWTVDSGQSGIDSCDVGLWCWDVDPETGLGLCVQLCKGSESTPLCTDPDEACALAKNFAICLPTCEPLVQDCPVGCGCYPMVDAFQCILDASGDMGAFGDPCEILNVCDPGLFCANADAVPGCTGSQGCCTTFCDVTEANTCPMALQGQQCIPLRDETSTPPGFENVGACVLPPQ